MDQRECLLLRTLLQDLPELSRRGDPSETCGLHLPAPFCEAFEPPPHDETRGDAARLIPILGTLTFSSREAPRAYYYGISPLSLLSEEFMPRQSGAFDTKAASDYRALWRHFCEEFNQLRTQEDFAPYFFTIFFLLKKYFSRVPSADARDVSLFDAARTRVAVADSRYQYRQEKAQRNQTIPEDPEEFLLIKGDLSGIQRFLTNLPSSCQENARTAMRLRGRSFQLFLLMESLSDYLLGRLNLTIAHRLWCSGGHFLMLAPHIPGVTYRFKSCYRDINAFLLREFRGELALALTSAVSSKITLMNDLPRLLRKLDRQLEQEKRCKMANVLAASGGFQFPSAHVERDDGSPPAVDAFTQHQLHRQEELGKKLTQFNEGYARLLKFSCPGSEIPCRELLESFQIDNTHISWAINPKYADSADTRYWINPEDSSDKFWGGGAIGYGFTYIASHADVYSSWAEVDAFHHRHPDTRVQRDQAKGFDALAEAGSGEFLGILRMDADHLGSAFSIGVPEPGLARLAALSSEIELFFNAYIQRLCRSEFRKHVAISYSGGDDLLIIGAWDELLDLACRIRQDFKTFCAHNPELDLSAALFLCKPSYSIPRAVERAKLLLERQAKENRAQEPDLNGALTKRHAIALFGHRMGWNDFLALKASGDEIVRGIQAGKIPRVFLSKVLDLHRRWQSGRQVNIARLYYMTIRRIGDPSARRIFLERLAPHQYLSHPSYLPILTSYAGLKTGRDIKESTDDKRQTSTRQKEHPRF